MPQDDGVDGVVDDGVSYGPHRVCHFCGGRIETATPVQARTGNAWAHFSCWYDGSPVRDAEGKII